MDEMATRGIGPTQERCVRALRSRAYDAIRNEPLVETTGEDLLTIMHATEIPCPLRRLHNLAVNLGWLAWPALAKAAWPKIRNQSKRSITADEHEKRFATAAEGCKLVTYPCRPLAAATNGASVRAEGWVGALDPVGGPYWSLSRSPCVNVRYGAEWVAVSGRMRASRPVAAAWGQRALRISQ